MCKFRCCWSCHYWRSDSHTREDRIKNIEFSLPANGICHRYPPCAMTKDFCKTKNYDWCGEWIEIEEAPKRVLKGDSNKT